MASGMVDAYSPHGFWAPDGNAFGMGGGWDGPMCPPTMEMNGFGGPYAPMAGLAQQTPSIPPGVPPELHEQAHKAGMGAYQQKYQEVVEQGLQKRQEEAKKLKEAAKEQKRQASLLNADIKKDNAGAKDEPMKIPISMPLNRTKQPAPPSNAPSAALPSKNIPPPPTAPPSYPASGGVKREADEVAADLTKSAPPGLGLHLPPGLAKPPGLSEPLQRSISCPLSFAEAKPAPSHLPGPGIQALKKTSDGTLPFQWTVDSRKLKTSDKVIVSPSFEWPEAEESAESAKFKLMIIPKAINDKKGGSSFKKAKGKAVVEVKCEANPPKKEVKLKLAVSDKNNPKILQDWRGPVQHNFSEANICNMKVPDIDEEWDLPFDNAEATFLVRLEIYDEDDDSD